MGFQAPNLADVSNAPATEAAFSPAEIEAAIKAFEAVKLKKQNGAKLDLTDVKAVVQHARVIRTEHFFLAEAAKKKASSEPRAPKAAKPKKVREPKMLTPGKLQKNLAAFEKGTISLADLHDVEFTLYGETRTNQEQLEAHNIKRQLATDRN